MVVMVVRDQQIGLCQTVLRDIITHRFGQRRIDDPCVGLVANQPDVVVAARGQGDEFVVRFMVRSIGR